MTDLFPQVVDKSTLTGVFNAGQFLVVGVEGQADNGGSATVGLPYTVTTAEQAVTYFGAASTLTVIVELLLARGLDYVVAVASKKGSTPSLGERQTAWANLEDDPTVRIRLTDSSTQADLVALAVSCVNAEKIQHKQFCVVGITAATKATVQAAATAVGSKRGVLVAPGIYDLDGSLNTGAKAAAYAAAEIAKNANIVDSLNLAPIPATAGIEKDATSGLPVYRLHTNGGTPLDDFEDLLTSGASPFQQSAGGTASFTHLRMTYTTDDTFDALMTLLIKDEVFLGIRDMLLAARFLRSGNTANNRALAGKMTDQWLKSHDDWVEPITLADGTTGYGVTVTPSADLKSFTVNYFGNVVRGTNVININGTLTIPVSS